MPDLLFELGCEEMPAGGIRRSMADLQAAVEHGLGSKRGEYYPTKVLGTPRRLILSVTGLPPREPDEVKTSRGPSLQAAYGPDGAPSKALEGFCRGQGVDPASLRSDGEYVWVDKHVPGRPIAEFLAELLPNALAGLNFDKTMRWGTGKLRFVRPVRWIVALLDGELVPFEFAGIESGKLSRGHRADYPDPFPVTDLDSLLIGLRDRNVEPDWERREERIKSGAKGASKGTPDLSPALVEENTFLTEWPTAHEGSFDARYLELPECVLVTSMTKHQRFFPVRDSGGKLMPKFVAIRNSGDEATVRSGNEWVLNARFNDAKFFFDQDKSKSMADFLAMTERMLFQEGLGTVRERADRLANLAGRVAEATGADSEQIGWAQQAGLYAKADLSSGLVSELASLQGQIGAEYAKREGFPDPVCTALAWQYDLGSVRGLGPKPDTAVRLIVADQLDKLAGFLGSGHVPKGSSDPFGLRRCATVLIEAARENFNTRSCHLKSGYSGLFESALDQYKSFGEGEREVARAEIQALFAGRYQAMADALTTYDVLSAAIDGAPLATVLDPRLIDLRTRALESFKLQKRTAAVQAATRVQNILNAHRAKGGTVAENFDPERLDSAEGGSLANALASAAPAMGAAISDGAADRMAKVVRDLRDPINEFFDSTMVMAEDLTVREHRLALLGRVEAVLLQVGDFTKLVLD